jgi:hypothetical protein
VKLSIRSTVLQLSPIAKVAGVDIDSNVSGHLGPPGVMQYELKCLKVACMSSDVCIMMLLHDATPKLFVFDHYICQGPEQIPSADCDTFGLTVIRWG